MARIRSIKPEFWVSEQIAECSPSARLTFIGMWNFCDDNGVHPAKPKTLKAELFPMDDFSATDLAEWVGELVRAGLVGEFTHQGVDFWHVTGWTKHQKIERPSCKYPRPPAMNSANPPRKLPEDSPNAHRGPPPGEERKGEDRNGGEKPASPKAQPAPDLASNSKSTTTASTGTRLATDWNLPEEYRVYCVKERPDLDPNKMAENFRDHWHGVAGAKGRRADWLATWRLWVRRENKRATSIAASGHRIALHADDMIGAAP